MLDGDPLLTVCERGYQMLVEKDFEGRCVGLSLLRAGLIYGRGNSMLKALLFSSGV